MKRLTLQEIKKNLAISLVILFLASITAATCVAVTDPSEFGPKSKQQYKKGLMKGKIDGKKEGLVAGKTDGLNDCLQGMPYDEDTNSDPNYLDDGSAYDIGYHVNYDIFYAKAYKSAYNINYNVCSTSDNQNTHGRMKPAT